jgi:hypothetical protein
VKAISMTFNPTKPHDISPATTPQQHHEQAAEHFEQAAKSHKEVAKKPTPVTKSLIAVH